MHFSLSTVGRLLSITPTTVEARHFIATNAIYYTAPYHDFDAWPRARAGAAESRATEMARCHFTARGARDVEPPRRAGPTPPLEMQERAALRLPALLPTPRRLRRALDSLIY